MRDDPGAGARARREARGFRTIALLLEDEFGRPAGRRTGDIIGSLVRTVLSQNTTDANSSRAYMLLRERFPEWEDVAAADSRSVAAAIRVGGLADTKARRIKRMLREIEKDRGELDARFLENMSTESVMDYLRGFEGVGSKTAACVALFELGRDIVPVDTHVHRVIGRLGVLGHPRTRDKTFEALRHTVPAELSLSLHVNLIRLGRTVCRPTAPRCPDCPLRTECDHAASSGLDRRRRRAPRGQQEDS